MRKGKVYYGDTLAGTITEMDDGEFVFRYDDDYVVNHPSQFISFNFPVRRDAYTDNRLFPVFEGLIPEGWLLDIASKSWKINKNDRMGLLLACCKDCIGALSIKPVHDEKE
ncbi:MAG TPA: HipA N-terminal domain-containing protein [Prolixibacteraceae bacterium]|nr:HipA N-terminal domain-containing protein [Prolixibacteraceae bacterium]